MKKIYDHDSRNSEIFHSTVIYMYYRNDSYYYEINYKKKLIK
jgi:hypothetical protein